MRWARLFPALLLVGGCSSGGSEPMPDARAVLFRNIPQSQVQACIDATNAMTCTELLDMYRTGQGVPAPCQGILNQSAGAHLRKARAARSAP